MAVAGSLQSANPAIGTVDRQPQTTGLNGSVFARLSRRSQIQGYVSSANAFGALINLPLKPAGGYLRGLWIKAVAAAGNGSTVNAVAAADGEEACIASLLLRDPSGQPIFQMDGYGIASVMRYSGQFGMAGFQDPHSLPSYSATTTNGAFTIQLFVPLELDSAGYCALPIANASALPQLTITLASAASAFATVPTPTTPTVTITVDEDFWAIPVLNPKLGPPDVGSSHQWLQSSAPQSIGSAASQKETLQTTGSYISSIIGVLRDSTGVRIDGFPATDATLWVDNVPVILAELKTEHYDKGYLAFGIGKRTGDWPITFRQAVQKLVGDADTHDLLLPTTPATNLELGGTWATITNAPAVLTTYTGMLWPDSGIPYSHLGQ